jgi:hypothetical protein
LEKDKVSKVEEISLNDLARINLEVCKFKTDLAVIGGYAARSFYSGEKLEVHKGHRFHHDKKQLDRSSRRPWTAGIRH